MQLIVEAISQVCVPNNGNRHTSATYTRTPSNKTSRQSIVLRFGDFEKGSPNARVSSWQVPAELSNLHFYPHILDFFLCVIQLKFARDIVILIVT